MDKSSEPKVTVSPSPESLKGNSKYDLPRQIDIIPRSILKTSNSPKHKD